MRSCNPFSSRRGVSRSTVAAQAILVVLSCMPLCRGQEPAATAVITDRANLPVAGRFGVPDQFKLTGAGDVFFTSGGNSALFRWRQSDGAPVRLLQTNDPIEVLGLPEEIMSVVPPGGLLDVTGWPLQVNGAGQAAFGVSVAMKGETDPSAVFLYDGASYRFIEPHVRTFTQLFLNNSGRVAVSGTGSVNFGIAEIGVETGDPLDLKTVATQGQPAPASVGGSLGSLSLIGMNDAGQVAILAGINGGSANMAVFVTDGGPLQLVVKSGDSAPGGGTFTLRTNAINYLLNGAGEVAFAADAAGGTAGIWIGKPSAAPVKLMRLSEPTGTALGGNFGTTVALRGFNDSGQALFSTDITGGASAHALFLKDVAAPEAQVVFSRGQSGGSAGTFSATQQAVLNNSGQVAFLAALTGGASPMGWYLGSGTASPVKIAVQGEDTPLGGKFGLAGRNIAASMNAAGQVVFLADIPDAGAVGLFSWTSADGVKPVVSTNDPLPEAANFVLRAGPPSSSDGEVVSRVLMAGGQATYYAHPLTPGTTDSRKIVAEFDQVPDAGIVVSPGNLSLNGKGEAVFLSQLLGSDVYPRVGLVRSRPEPGLEKVAFRGDDLPGGGTISSFGAPLINNQTQIAFQVGTNAGGAGIFLVSPETPSLQPVVRTGVPWPEGGTNTLGSVNANIALNDQGQVAFLGTSPPNARPGLYIGSATGSPLKVVQGMDPAPVATFVSMNPPYKLNADGKVAFMGNYGNGPTQAFGIFVGSADAPPQLIAATGSAAPGASGLTFSFFNSSAIDLNRSGQVAFWAGLCCNNNFGGGWFLGSAGAATQSRLLGSQPLPDGGVVNSGIPGVARTAVLADSGEMAFWVGNTRESKSEPHLVIAGVDGKLRRLALGGEKAEGTESEFGALSPFLTATQSGRFLFSAILVNGPAKAGIFTSLP